MKKINFLFCNHPLYCRKPDMDYETEYQEARLNLIIQLSLKIKMAMNMKLR